VAAAVSPAAQAQGSTSFRVLEHGMPIGSVSISVNRDDTGWHVQSASRLGGSIDLDITRFDATYDRTWGTKFVTLEWAHGNARRIIQVAVGSTRAQTDTVIPDTEARFGAHRVSPGTIALPDYVFGAYVALAARLEVVEPGASLPLLLSPRGEFTAEVDAVGTEDIATADGPVTARHVSLIVYRDGPTPIEIWSLRGELWRVELPEDGITVAREP
jgi:hypothetical protein